MNQEELEEKLKELREKYSRHLRDGETDKATDVYWQAERLKGDVEESEEEEVNDDFEKLDGVGDELARELADKYSTLDNLAEASVDDLKPIPGIGQKRAESLIEQVNE